ncbi:MAG: macro domain-containing protein [Fimbriimonadales bacterium]|nr:macro domain-containing protein [Fimbriimonadales bacterium]
MLWTASHPWMTRVRPTASYTVDGARVELYVIPHTSLHRVTADALILATDATMRMTRGFRKQLRDYAGFDLVEQEAVSCAPLPPQGVAITGAGRTRFKRVLHANLYDAQFTTSAELQLQGLLNALTVAAERGMQTIAFADYTLDLRRALAEETAWTIAQAIAQRPRSLQQFKIICTDAVNGWAFQQILRWVSQRGFEPYRAMYRVRHTMLHAAQGDWQKIPAHGLWRFTEPDLRPEDTLIRRGGQILQTKTRAVAPVALGDAAITAGGALQYPFVVHLATLEGGQIPSRETLVAAVRAALSLSHNQNLRTVLIPTPHPLQGISHEEFAQTLIETISDYLHSLISRLERCILVGASESEYQAWQGAVNALRETLSLPPLEDMSED